MRKIDLLDYGRYPNVIRYLLSIFILAELPVSVQLAEQKCTVECMDPDAILACPPGLIPFCVSQLESQEWEASEQTCAHERPAHLIDFNYQADFYEVSDLVDINESDTFWIGLQIVNESSARWVDGTEFQIETSFDRFPNYERSYDSFALLIENNQVCAYMNVTENSWHWGNCAVKRPALCRENPAGQPGYPITNGWIDKEWNVGETVNVRCSAYLGGVGKLQILVQDAKGNLKMMFLGDTPDSTLVTTDGYPGNHCTSRGVLNIQLQISQSMDGHQLYCTSRGTTNGTQCDDRNIYCTSVTIKINEDFIPLDDGNKHDDGSLIWLVTIPGVLLVMAAVVGCVHALLSKKETGKEKNNSIPARPSKNMVLMNSEGEIKEPAPMEDREIVEEAEEDTMLGTEV